MLGTLCNLVSEAYLGKTLRVQPGNIKDVLGNIFDILRDQRSLGTTKMCLGSEASDQDEVVIGRLSNSKSHGNVPVASGPVYWH